MARLLRQQPYHFFVIGLREVYVAVDDIKIDQQTEWTTSLRYSMKEFADIIQKHGGLPPTRECDLKIDLECDQPPKERTYRMSSAELREVQVHLQDLLAKDWICPSRSPYGAPTLFVRKKDETMRMCVDYQKLYHLARKDRTPLPQIDDLLDSRYGAHYFIALDMYKGYHLVRVKERDIHKTAFRTHYGLFEYCVLPFGLCNAPCGFQSNDESSSSPVSWQVLRGICGRIVYL
jgi:hypothetical protein